MGVFNTIPHPEFPNNSRCAIQFKHGFCWLYEYEVGDRLTWEPIERPPSAEGKLSVGGIGERPDGEHEYFEIFIEDDIITGATKISEERFEELESES